jgi:AcrR family transcriptional regulator
MSHAGQTPLSRTRVLDGAVRMADQQGLAALSMRKLAAELGVEAMSLYNHVPSKAALLSGMLERMLEQLEIPSGPGFDWTDRLRHGATSFLLVARTHPSFIQLLTSQHIHTGTALAPTAAVIGIFRSAGFADQDATRAYQALVGYVLGFILQQDVGTIGLSCCGQDESCAHRLSLPGAGADPAADFEFGLDLVLLGLAAKLRG